MMNQQPEWTTKRITEVFRNGDCFTAAQCGKRKTKANVPHPAPSWVCRCGNHNLLHMSGVFIPWETPDIGPARDQIRRAPR